jgi:hypothetical protein
MTTIGGFDGINTNHAAQFQRQAGAHYAGPQVTFGSEADSFISRKADSRNRSNFYIPFVTESIGMVIAGAVALGGLFFGLKKGGFIRKIFSGGFNGIKGLLERVPVVGKFFNKGAEAAAAAAPKAA